jgi:hypothetical protein
LLGVCAQIGEDETAAQVADAERFDVDARRIDLAQLGRSVARALAMAPGPVGPVPRIAAANASA